MNLEKWTNNKYMIIFAKEKHHKTSTLKKIWVRDIYWKKARKVFALTNGK